MVLSWKKLITVALGVLVWLPPAGAQAPPSTPAVEFTSLTVKNISGKAISDQLVSLAFAIQTGDVPAARKIQIRKNDGTTILTTQEDACSKWAQDNSRKVCAVSFVEPDTLSPGQSAIYKVFSVSGAPDTTPKVTNADIIAHTDIALKTSNLTRAQGAAEAGTWDLISLNYVLASCAQYNRPNGYGANPRCGWDVVAKGPNRYGIHAFQYARREGDRAIHDWLRTDIWVDFWGSGTTPCPCSVALQVAQPNTWGPIAGGSVGSSPQGGYIFAAQLLNGSNVIYDLGGPGDSRVSPVSFDHAAGRVIFAGGTKSWVENTAGVFGVSFSGGKLPTGLTPGTAYFFYTFGANPDLITNKFAFYPYQCAAAQSCPTAVKPVSFTDDGSGTITATPLVTTTPFAGFLGLDSTAQRFWINAAGKANAPPPLLLSHEFNYLTQKSKAVPPYIPALFGRLLRMPGPPDTFYPGTYYFPFDMNTTGDGPGDERIGYINRTGVYSLFMPYDPIAVQNSLVIAASFGVQHMYHEDETVGFPDVFNNGPAKKGTSYPTLGIVQPNQRTYPYSTGTRWLTPSTNFADLGSISERYGVWLDPSHLPAPQQAPYLKTGQPEWQAQLVLEANAVIGNMQVSTAQIGKNTYYRVLAPALKGFANQQTRGVAWARRIGDMADFFQPAGSPISQYLHDLVADDVGYTDDFATNGTSKLEKSLGYYWNDVRTGGTGYQWWQDDFVFLAYGMTAWRGEYPHATSFLTNYFYKQVITRLDAASSVGGGGCLWVGPARVVAPWGTGTDPATLPATWNGFYSNTTAVAATVDADWGKAPWRGCGAQSGGFIVDSAGTNPAVPNGLTSIMAASLAMGSLIGIPHADTLYATIRKLQYHGPCTNCPIPLSFISFRSAGTDISEPTFAIGPLGAVN
jgi:hypothetical protein